MIFSQFLALFSLWMISVMDLMGLVSVLVLLDISATFDAINHGIVLD